MAKVRQSDTRGSVLPQVFIPSPVSPQLLLSIVFSYERQPVLLNPTEGLSLSVWCTGNGFITSNRLPLVTFHPNGAKYIKTCSRKPFDSLYNLESSHKKLHIWVKNVKKWLFSHKQHHAVEQDLWS